MMQKPSPETGHIPCPLQQVFPLPFLYLSFLESLSLLLYHNLSLRSAYQLQLFPLEHPKWTSVFLLQISPMGLMKHTNKHIQRNNHVLSLFLTEPNIQILSSTAVSGQHLLAPQHPTPSPPTHTHTLLPLLTVSLLISGQDLCYSCPLNTLLQLISYSSSNLNSILSPLGQPF